MRRVGLLLALSLTLLLTREHPARAHGAKGVEATNYVTTIDGVSPRLPGVRVRLVDAGNGLELRNSGPEVVVLGYRDEPFLRVGPDGAFENRLSPTVAGNRERQHGNDASGDVREAPQWQKLSDEPVARWHDHRIHWMGADPPSVAADPGTRQVVQPPWQVVLLRGPERAIVSGQLTWVPGPSPAPWLGLMAAAFAAVAALGLMRRWGPALAGAVALVLGADLLHALGAALASPGGLGAQLGRVVSGSFYAIFGWLLAGVALRLLVRGRVDGLYAGVFAGLSIGVFGGLLDVTTLSRSGAPFALPLPLVRTCIALAAGGGFGLAAACLVVIRRTPEARRVVGGPHEDDEDDEDQSRGAPIGESGPRPVGADGARGLR